jgi:outer membrane protein assembly factor BamA
MCNQFFYPSQKKVSMQPSIFIRLLLLWIGLFAGATFSQGQSVDTVSKPAAPRDYKRLDIFPAISYSPETKLTLGAIGIYYLDLRKGDRSTPLSNIDFLAVYTLSKQVLLESRWEVFTHARAWRTRGELLLQQYPDRNYGIGNDASVLVAEVDKDGNRETLNYLNYNSNRIKFSPVVLRKIRPNLYVGLQSDLEYVYKYKVTADQYYFLNADSALIYDLPIAGLRSGMGFQILYDNRDNLINPLSGTFVEFNDRHYGKWMGSDYTFSYYSLELRQYINTWSNHTLALRGLASLEYTNDAVPLRALSRVGGHKFIRGYFKGTYQDHHMLAFEAEYRLPLWREGQPSKLWQVWKRLGVVGFLGGAEVFQDSKQLSFSQFNLAAGGGLRILLNPKSRSNIRIDYAIALRDNSDGPGKRQSGFYFFLGEAF